MLKTNSKQLKEKVNNYLMECAQNCAVEYDNIQPPHTIEQAKKIIIDIFKTEKLSNYNSCKNTREILKKFFNDRLFTAFRDWTSGLCGAVGSHNWYLYGREWLGDLLEESEEQRGKYTQEQIEEVGDWLIFKNLFDSPLMINYIME